MSKNDDTIKELLKTVEAQKASLGKKERASWRTNGVFKSPNGPGINLNTVQKPSVLVDCLATLLGFELSVAEANKRLGTDEPLSWDGYSVEDWEEDFKTRLRIIEYDKKKKALDATEKKLGTLMSEDARTESALDDIKSSLGL
jgi:hypothetical protein